MVKRLEKKKMILNAAMECFSQTGYEKTTLDEIGGKVNLNKASLYYYYNSKEDIFSDVIYAEAARFREDVKNKLVSRDTLEDKIVFFLSERAKFYNILAGMQFTPYMQVPKQDHDFNGTLQTLRLEEKGILTEIIRESYSYGQVNRIDPMRLAEVLLKISSVFRVGDNKGQGQVSMMDSNGKANREGFDQEEIRLTIRLILLGARSES